MLDPSVLVAFVPAAVVLILAPGPDTVYVLSRGLGDGRLPGVAGAAGVATGVLVHTAAVALGLAVLLRTVPAAYTVIRYAGAAYLCYLGVRTLLDESTFDLESGRERGVARSYAGGLLVNALNPKVALFFLAFLPQFLPAEPSLADPFVLGGVYALLTVGYLGVVAVAAEAVREHALSRPRVRTGLRALTGSVLGAFGLSVALRA
jgi:threonine/homoserine/homoserine lactone efflux protein